MQLKKFVATGALLLLVGAACPSQPAAPAPGGAQPEEIPPAVTPDTMPDAAPGAGTGTGTSAGIKASGKLPANFPKDFPIMPGLVLVGTTSSPRVDDSRYQNLKATFQVKDIPMSTIYTYYEKAFIVAEPDKPPTRDAWVLGSKSVSATNAFVAALRYESGTWNAKKDAQISMTQEEGGIATVVIDIGLL